MGSALLLPGRLLKVLTYPHATLRAKCERIAISPPAPSALQLAADLLATVREQNGLGLAAPQVGHALRLVALRVPAARTEAEARRLGRPARRVLGGAGAHFVVAANPELLPLPGARAGAEPADGSVARDAERATRIGYEACLSIPGTGSLVRRNAAVRLRYWLIAASDPRTLPRLRRLERLAALEARADGAADATLQPDSAAGEAPVLVDEVLEGLPAVVAQHELDHLDGVLITDRELKHFPNSTFEREMDVAQLRFAASLSRHYADESGAEA